MSPPSDQDKRPREADTAPIEAPPSATIELVLPAEWVAPSIARDRVRSWLTAHRWSPTHQDDLVLAVSEAISNSVEHGYGIDAEDPAADDALTGAAGTIELHGRVTTERDGSRHVEFVVRDQGRWLQPAMLPGNRGHGMTLMRACTDQVTIDYTPQGTTVVLRSRRLPPPLRRI